MNDYILISKCQKKDPLAQRQLFDRYYNYIYTIGIRYIKNHHDTEDVVSEIFNRIFLNIDKVLSTNNQGLKRWIQTIAINESLRFINKKHPIDYTGDDKLLEPDNITLNESDSGLDIKLLKQKISQLPEGYRRIFLLNIVEGLSHTEIAQHLGISRNTSKSQMLKARKHLQLELKKHETAKLR